MPTHSIPNYLGRGGIVCTTRIHQFQLSNTTQSTNQHTSSHQYNPFTGTTTYSTSSQMRQEQVFSSAQTSSSGTYNHGNVSDITSSNLHQCNATFSGHQHFPFPPAEALSPPLSSASSCKSTATPSLASSRRRRGPSVRSDDSDRIPRIYLYGGDDHMAYNDMHGQPSSRSMKMPDYLYLGWRKKKLEKDPKKEYHWARPIKKLK